jgi:hypothetical protein
MRSPAVGTLVIAILHEGDGGVGRTLCMIAIADRWPETHGPIPQEVDADDVASVSSESRASRMPSAPGFTAIGDT